LTSIQDLGTIFDGGSTTKGEAVRYAALLALFLAFPGMAAGTQLGLHAGLFLPTGDAGDAFNASPFIGGQVLFHLPLYAVEGSASYVFLSSDADTLDNYSAHMIPLLLGIRSYMTGFFYGGGAELTMSSVSWDVGDTTEESSESDFGAYGVVGTELPLGGNEIELVGRLHWVDFDDIWLSVQAGIYF
jgi:hypothetical protein